MSEALIGLVIGLAVGFLAGARWYWRMVDEALREFEDKHASGPRGSVSYRIARLVR